jgi:Asp-tRNA(Asn)/Glu-tRNA(Gln) amidotransferase A subunit family amidase
VLRRLNQQTLDDLRSLGMTLTPIDIPEWSVSVTAHNVEMAVFFDELLRSGRADLLGQQRRADGLRSARLIPAVEYLQSQRARTMMMMRLAKATAGVDVYLVPRGTRRRPPAGGDAAPPADPPADPPPYSASRNASNMTNYACHPAVAVPNGFNENGTPASMTFYAQPFKESQLLAVARAYQDATGHHLKHPDLDSAAEGAGR